MPQIGAPTSESIGFHGGGGDDGLNISDEELSDEQLRDRERNRNDDDDDSRKDDFQYPKLNFKILRSPPIFLHALNTVAKVRSKSLLIWI